MQRDQFNSGRYCNWVKGSLSLCYLKEGVTEFSNEKAVAFHRDIVQRVSLRHSNVASAQCGSCTHKQAVKTKSKDKKSTTWRMNCRMNICSGWLEEILPYHRHQPCPDIAWKNSDPRLWPSDCWEVAKIFQPYGCQQQRRAEDCDATGLLTMIQDCRFFSKFISNPAIIQDIKAARNACMHSNDLEMSDADMQQSLNLIVTFLEEPELQKHQTARDAVVKIKQLRDNILDLSLNKELELEALHNKMTEMEQNVTSVKDVTQNLRDDINIRMDSLREDISDLRLTSQVHEATITTLYQRQQDTDGELQRARQVSQAHESRLRHQQGDIDTHKAQIGGHELRLQSHQGDIDTHKVTLGGHELRLDSQHRQLEFHEAKLDTLGRHQQELQQQHQGKVFNVEDVRATLVGLYKERLHCIPIYLIKPDWKHPVEDLFVKQQLRRVDPRGKPEHSDNPHVQMAGNPDHNKHATGNDKHIDKVTDVFFKDGKLCKDVYITSEAGYGKTSLCAHLVRLWCDAHSKSEADLASADPNLAKDLQSMKKFSVLFYINLRDADIPIDIPKSDEISLLVHTQLELSDQDYSIVDVKRCLSDPSTLVLMDSLDEMRSTRLPYRGLHNKSCIVTTSRPWKLEALRSQLHSKIGYQQIEIVGLTETSPKDLVKNVLKILNKEYDQAKNGGEFLDAIKKSGLQDFLTIPVLILQMLSLWFDGESFGRSQSEIYSNVVHHQILTTLKTKELPVCEGISRDNIPFSCFSDPSCPCKAYADLLWKVSTLAFNTLFGENGEMCMVFDHKITSFSGLSDEEVEICLKMGMLTQHKLFVQKMSEDKKDVSFLHKTNQEYFAAVYLSYRWSETVKMHILSVISDLDRAMELDKVLLFCSQLNPEVARELSGLISVRADNDRRVQEYRQSDEYAGKYSSDASNINLIYKIQNIVSAAVQQTISSPQPTTQESPSHQPAVASTPSTQDRSTSAPKLFLADIILGGSQLLRTEKDRRLVEALDMADVKSVRIAAEEADVTIWKHLEQARCLRTLVVDKGKEIIKVETLHGIVVKNKLTLRTLGLYGDYLQLDLWRLGNKLADMLTCDLTCILLRLVNISHKQCKMLGRHLSTTQNLRQLSLSSMTFSHEQNEILCRHLSTTINLRQLTLYMIKCRTHGYSQWDDIRVKAGCCDVKLHSELELLKFSDLPFSLVSFPADGLKTCEIELHDNVPATTSAILCLTSASNLSNLREFRCQSLRNTHIVRLLTLVLPQLHGLQRIVLTEIDFCCLGEMRLSFAVAKTLKYVTLQDCYIAVDVLESLVQSVDAPRVRMELSNVIFRRGDPTEFLQRLRDSPDVEVPENIGEIKHEGDMREIIPWYDLFYIQGTYPSEDDVFHFCGQTLHFYIDKQKHFSFVH